MSRLSMPSETCMYPSSLSSLNAISYLSSSSAYLEAFKIADENLAGRLLL
jgi:hypothetical protein